MDVKNKKSLPDFRMSLHGLPYHETVAARPPIPFIPPTSSASPPPETKDPLLSAASLDTDNLATSVQPESRSQQHVQDVAPQKYGSLLQTGSSVHGSQTSIATNDRAPSSLTSAPSVPQIRVDDEGISPPIQEESGKSWLSLRPKKLRTNTQEQPQAAQESFQGISLDLPTGGGLGEELQSKKMQFSNRGSMLLDGRKVSDSGPAPSGPYLGGPASGTQRVVSSLSVPDRLPPRVMSTDEEALSEKVRSYYEIGSDDVPQDMEAQTTTARRMGLRWQDAMQSETESMKTLSRAGSASDMPRSSSGGQRSIADSSIVREEHELAGGVEDWQNVDNDYVDRYGFIVPRVPISSGPAEQIGVKRSPTTNGSGLQRVSTSLQLASESPRKKHTLRGAKNGAEGESPGIKRQGSSRSNKSNSRPASAKSGTIQRHGTFRAASNRLPNNKDRRLMDEAADMLTLPRALSVGSLTRSTTAASDRSENSSTPPTTSKSNSQAARRKEAERVEKWRKMAKPISSSKLAENNNGVGGGMLFDFPHPSDAKLISRTWKGIPDSWRSAAWHYFLSVSARKNPNSLADDKLISFFFVYQDQSSPDDVQIDIDVPRTISSHIMFRRRYRGGQRLLFRVLHAMSLHFVETGYVQGMAALAATLLAYYEEEKAFVMLVRLWETRGLGRLYQNGFGGLMEALGDFEARWLGEGEVAKKLTDLNVFPTAYGTKWYLTLFNYSVPFPAQLRVWDVFMLLGDDDSIANFKPPPDREEYPPLGRTLDVLHATSAALIDGMRDILLESDFENSMKVLTSWIPIRDEDLFMRVTRAEWKVHHKKA